jgi:hypothetical protein
MSPNTDPPRSSTSISEEETSKIEGGASSDKSHESQRGNSEDVTFAPITGVASEKRGAPLQKQKSNASKSLERSWSLNDGVSIGGNDVEAEQGGAEDDDSYTVGWEDNDPLNPRNMSTTRRWLVTMIVSMGSLCV